MNKDDGQHVPVLVREVEHYLNCVKGGVYVDATVGSGGHAIALLRKYPGIGMLVGIDRDANAVAIAGKNLRAFHERAVVVQGNFRALKPLLEKINIQAIDGILFDFGVSSMQLQDPLRGFSFMTNGPLDMRMDQKNSLQAKDLINTLPASEMEKLIRTYGEERWARRIARHIEKRRKETSITTTKAFASIVAEAIPAAKHTGRIHPATKTFQAFRIAVNDELHSIRAGLDEAVELLRPGGRICAISFHSLEDRIVKQKFFQWAKGCICPSGVPVCLCNEKKRIRIITRKPVVPLPDEILANPRSRSAKLRVAEKL